MMKQLLLNQRKTGGRVISLLVVLLTMLAMTLLPQRAWAARYDTSNMPTLESGTNVYKWSVYTTSLGQSTDYSNQWTITPGADQQQTDVFSVYTGEYERYAELHGSATLTLQGPANNTRKIHKVAISGLQAIDSKEETISGTITVTLKNQNGGIVATFTQDSRPAYYNCYNLAEPVVWNANNYVEISFSGCEVKFYQLNVIDGEELNASDFSWPSELTDISNPTLSTENGTTLTYTGASGSFDFPLMYNNEVFTNAYYTSSASVASVGNGENVGKVTVYKFGSTTITAEVGDDDYLPLSFSYTLNVVPAAGTYNLFVADVQVTSDNASNIKSQYLTSGSASFNAATNTLTLNNASIGYGGIQSGLENLTIVFNGTNTFDSYIGANTAVAGTHSLTLQSGTEGSSISLDNTVGKSFIDGFDNISMDGLYISSEYPWAYDSAAKKYVQAHLPKGYILQEATITSVPHYSLWIGGTQLTDANMADVFSGHNTLDGKVSFESSTNTLSLNGAALGYSVFSNLSSLTINVSGECSIGGGDSATAVRTAVPSTLTLKSTGTGNRLAFNNARCIRDFSSVTLSGLYWDDNYTYGEGPVVYWDSDAQQEIQTTGKQLLDASGEEVGYAVASSEIEFPKEFMYHHYVDGVYTIGFEGGGEIHYSIDYADAELTDVENAVYNREDNEGQIELAGPCTFTAWKVVGTAQSAPITAKLFGFAETEITAVKGSTDNAIPEVVPPIAEVMEVMYSSSDEDMITNSENGTFNTNAYGTAVISGYLKVGNNAPDYVILNEEPSDFIQIDQSDDVYYQLGDITVTTVPDAPTFSLSPDEAYRGDQSLELSTTEEEGIIKYFIGEYEDNDNPQTYTEAITLTESTSVTAWVEVSVESEAATTGPQTVKSEVVTREFNITPIAKYGIIIYPAEGEPVEANEVNCVDVLDDGGTVKFDGNSRLVLNGATLQKIETGLEEGAKLELYLEGANTISGSTSAIIDTNQRMPKLVIDTDGNNPGSLTLGGTRGVIQGFQSVDIKHPLAIMSPEGATSLIGTTAAITSAHVGAPLGLIVDGVSSTPQTTETAINYSDISGANEPVATSALTNLVINNVLYTLNDDGTVGSPDGYDGSRRQIVLNSTMTDDYVSDINVRVENELLVPGTDAYATAFNGLTFMVPADMGTITLNTKTDLAHEFHLKVGGQDPITVINYTDNNDVDFAVDYAVSKSTYVYLYLVKKSSATAPGFGGHRAGPKATISGGIGGMKVESSSIAVVPEPSTPYYQMTTSDYRKAYGSKHGIKVTNTAVTDLPDNAFATASPAPAYSGNRAPAGDISYIDLSDTQITGKAYNRTSGAFAGVPENTVIYLPAGNTAEGPNFVIGGVCDDMQLDASTEEAFELSKDFTAAKATFDRSFTKGKDAHNNDKCYTVYLPYAVNIAKTGGEFFTCGEYNAATGTINMTNVTAPNLEANTAYIYKPAADGQMSPMTSVKVKKPTTASDPTSTSEATGLHGVYEYHQWTSEPGNVYCFAAGDATAVNGKDIKAGQFVKVGSGTHIKPFRAYLRINVPAGGSAPEYVAVDWGNGTTSIVPLDKTQVSQDADGWYTITGFRLPAKPTEKGIYIHNNKKTIVK